MNTNYTNSFLLFLTLSISLLSCQGQSQQLRIVGGPCEGCEALTDDLPNKLSNTDTLPFFAFGDNAYLLTGTVYESKTDKPAADIIIYIYHTNSAGVYLSKPIDSGWSLRHGLRRGWIKTNKDGRYSFYSIRPGSYPNSDEPQHIHMTVKEPNTIPYYLDSVVFTDDPLLTPEKISRLESRGGSGVVTPQLNEDGLMVLNRDIYLGLNIPDYD